MKGHIHVANYSGIHAFAGWVRRTIDREVEGVKSGCIGTDKFVICRTRHAAPGLLEVDVYTELQPGEARSIDYTRPDAAVALPVFQPTDKHIVPRLNGVPMHVRSAVVNGAALEMHWRTRIVELVVADLWVNFYPQQRWAEGELQLHASNLRSGKRSQQLPDELTLDIAGGTWGVWSAQRLSSGGSLIPPGLSIGHGQGLPAIPVVLVSEEATPEDVESAAAVVAMSIGCIALDKVWPTGNPHWHPKRGDAAAWVGSQFAKVRDSMSGWDLTPHTFATPHARVSGGEPDQTFVGAEMTQGLRSAGSELMMAMRGASMARRPGLWSEDNGDPMGIVKPSLALFQGYPFRRGGSIDMLGFSGVPIPDTRDTNGYWCWREHMFYNALFVGYRATGKRSLQWQIERRAVTYLHEHTKSDRYTTTRYTGAARGYGWSCLLVWWLLNTLESEQLRDAVRERWIARWEIVGKNMMTTDGFWPMFQNGARQEWFAWQAAPIAYFLDLVALKTGVEEAQDAAKTIALRVLQHAYAPDEQGNEQAYGYVMLQDGKPKLPLSEHSRPPKGVESWMVTAAATVLRHEPHHQQARMIVDQAVAKNEQDCRWVPPEVIAHPDSDEVDE